MTGVVAKFNSKLQLRDRKCFQCLSSTEFIHIWDVDTHFESSSLLWLQCRQSLDHFVILGYPKVKRQWSRRAKVNNKCVRMFMGFNHVINSQILASYKRALNSIASKTEPNSKDDDTFRNGVRAEWMKEGKDHELNF